METPKEHHHSIFKVPALRLLLSAYFCIYCYVVANSLIPLPDQPPRIEFLGVAAITGGIILAIACLIAQHRGFWWLGLCFFPIAALQLIDKMKFLEMMLEPFTIERVTRYSLGLLLVLWFTPPIRRLFPITSNQSGQSKAKLLPSGLPF